MPAAKSATWIDRAWRYGPGTVAAGVLGWFLLQDVRGGIKDITARQDTQIAQNSLLFEQNADIIALDVLMCKDKMRTDEGKAACDAVVYKGGGHR